MAFSQSSRIPLAVLAIAAFIFGGVLASLPGGPAQASSSCAGVTRTHYISADAVDWNYTPSGMNEITGEPFEGMESLFTQTSNVSLGSEYTKAQYREYADANFTALVPIPATWQHLGILGPAIHAQVGDTIQIVFKNNLPFPVGMHPHGVFYDKKSEGALYNDTTSGDEKTDDMVAPGASVTYTWLVPERAGPGPNDASSLVWSYHGHTKTTNDTNAGLVGPIIVTKCGMARADGSPKDVDRELVFDYQIFDETKSPFFNENIAQHNPQVNQTSPLFEMSNKKHSMNGYLYGNLPLDTVTVKKGEHVRWYLMGEGGSMDMHTAHWHGSTVLEAGRRADVISLFPAITKTADMVPDDPGVWLWHCHVNDHMDNGMAMRYKVEA